MSIAVCPLPTDLERLFLGGLPTADAETLEQHVLECAACSTQLDQLFRAKETLAVVLCEKTGADSLADDPVVADLLKKVASLRPAPGRLPQGKLMITIPCSACQKKLSVKENAAGKKVKCPACGQLTAVPAALAIGAANNEALPSLPAAPSLEPPTPQPDADAAPTNPPSENPDATLGVQPDWDHDSSLTDFLAPPQAPDELGRLGAFRILKILGHGGMGVVFLGDDPTLDRKVAIKAMLPHLGQSKSSRQRFLREARAAAALEHDNIVAIHHVGEDRGAPYIVMPLLKGQPLDERLKNGPAIPLLDILRIGQEIAAGLHAAHKTGLIHRDIKPANIWLETTAARGLALAGADASAKPQAAMDGGRVKILDFGLARPASGDAGLTQQGAIVGTPAYMAPEQGRGDPVDARSDLFSLGVVLYRLCTGKQPFHGNDAMSTLMAIAMNDPPAPIKFNSELPPELSDLVMKLLEKDAQKRIQSADEVMRSLQALEKELIRKKEARENTVALAVSIKPKSALDQALFAVERTQPGEPSRVSGRVTPPVTGLSRGSARPKFILAYAAVFAFFSVLAAGIIYYFQTNNGVVRVEITDPKIKVVIEGDDFTFTNVDKKEIRMKPGKHGLSITRDDFTFNTSSFELKRGETVTLSITLLQSGKLLVLQGTQKIGEAELANAKTPPIPAPSPHALAFDGKSSYVIIPSLKYDGGSPLTLEGWAVLERGTDNPRPDFLIGNYDRGARGLALSNGRLNEPRKWSFDCVFDNPYQFAFAEEKQPPPRHQLVHLAGVYLPKSEMRFYVDGRLQSRRPAPLPHRYSEVPFALGANPGDATGKEFAEHFLGRMNGVRISKVARYDKDFTPARRFEPDKDTIALYHFDEGSGNVLKDSSGNGHHGKIVGAKWVKVDGSPNTFSPQATPHALWFDGATSRVVIPALSYQGDHPLTVEAWAVLERPADNTAREVLWSNAHQGGLVIGNVSSSSPQPGQNEKWGFHVFDRVRNAYVRAVEMQPLPRRQLIHVAGVYDPQAEVRFYLNGVLQEAKPSKGPYKAGASPFTLGATSRPDDKFNEHFLGSMQGVRVSKVARYTGNFTPAKRFEPDKDTLALYHFDEGSGNVLKDSSGNGHHGKIVGAKWLKTDGTPAYIPRTPEEKEAQQLQRDWAKKLNREVETPSPSGIVMVVIPPDGKALSKPYLIGKYEVTQSEWEAVMGYNPSDFKKGNKAAEGMDTTRFPVENVSWFDSVEFCNKLSAKEGLKPYYDLNVTKRFSGKRIEDAEVKILGGNGYHIPTDAEWEHACRAGSKTKYHFGDKDEELPEYAWFDKNSEKRPHRAGELKPNAFGLFDMHGNIWEWNEEMLTRPDTGAPQRGTRGGHWHSDIGNCRVDYRYRFLPAQRHTYIGLRLAKGFPPELVGPGPWQPLLDAKMSEWWVEENKQTAAVTVMEAKGEPVLQMRNGGKSVYVTTKKNFPSNHARFEFQFTGKKHAYMIARYSWGENRKSGVQFYIDRDGNPMMNFPWAVANLGQLERGAIAFKAAYKDVDVKLAAVNLAPAGSWNRLDMVRDGDRVAFFVNGRFSGAVTDIRTRGSDKEAPLGKTAINLNCGAGELLVRRIEARDIDAFRPEMIEPAPWQPLLDTKLSNWRQHDNKQPDAITLADPAGEPALRLRKSPKQAYVSSNRKFHNNHLRLEFQYPAKGLGELNAAYVTADGKSGIFFVIANNGVSRGYLTEAKIHEATLERGAIASKGTIKGAGNLNFANAIVEPAGAWNRLDLVWIEDRMAFFVNGRFLGAVAEIRRVLDGKDIAFDETGINLECYRGEVLIRRIEVRDITALPPELLAKAPFPPLDPVWEKAVAAMKPAAQVEAVKAELMKRNPGFDGKSVQYKIDDAGAVTEFALLGDAITDISPVRALPQLRRLDCTATWASAGAGKLADLSPLKDMKNLRHLFVGSSRVADLSPLKDLSLWSLNVGNTPVSDLTPLQSMKELNWLNCGFTKISNLTPIKNLPLKSLWAHRAKELDDLTQIQNMKLTSLKIGGTTITDLTPIKGMPLTEIECDFNAERHAAILRSIKTLATINGQPAADFLKEMDAKKVGK